MKARSFKPFEIYYNNQHEINFLLSPVDNEWMAKIFYQFNFAIVMDTFAFRIYFTKFDEHQNSKICQ